MFLPEKRETRSRSKYVPWSLEKGFRTMATKEIAGIKLLSSTEKK